MDMLDERGLIKLKTVDKQDYNNPQHDDTAGFCAEPMRIGLTTHHHQIAANLKESMMLSEL
ncbi:hypothetical protein J22TS3_49670 [Paenibacillus sp. J22TS3]|nr:hypothetical protein J22TS3_49670 [Paenibacillus sp. J22TS3]